MTAASNALPALTMRRILKTWWPLAASWLLMGAETPALTIVIARLAAPEINLAAWGGVIYPLSLIVEAPVIMLLAASTALSKDWASYQKLRRFMLASGAALTALHLLLAFTPLYGWVVGQVLKAPAEVVGAARVGLMIMTPWTWSIAYRRFHQGVLIRFGHSGAVGFGTAVRLSADALILGIGYLLSASQALPQLTGVMVAAAAVATGVVSEAVYVGRVVRPVLKYELKPAPRVAETLTLRSFLVFYFPLVMTSLLTLLANPIGSAALGRMPEALASLAVWPVVTGLIFMFRSLGIAFNEVVVALLDMPGSEALLRRFTAWLAALTTLALLLIAATPLAGLWFARVSALPPHLADLARSGLWVALPLPALSVLQSWYQGAILHGRVTRGITEAVIIYLTASVLVLVAGVRQGGFTGLYVGLAALVVSTLAQTAWLWLRSRPSLQALQRHRSTPAF